MQRRIAAQAACCARGSGRRTAGRTWGRIGAACVLGGAVLLSAAAVADGTAWLPEPRSGHVSLSWVHQTADEYWRGSMKRSTAESADLTQGTLWLTSNYALGDNWSVDVQAGWAKSDFITGEGIPTTAASFSGRTDATVGITRRLVDEATGPYPSIALRVAGIAAGNYQTGHINSLGDGGNGYQVSAVAGKFLGARVGVSGEIGYRDRDGAIPAEHFVNIAGLWLVSDAFTLGVDYRIVDSRSGLDIGALGFTPALFPHVQEDHRSLGLRLYINLDDVGLNVFHSRVLDGRNTAASHVFGVAASRAFGGY